MKRGLVLVWAVVLTVGACGGSSDADAERRIAELEAQLAALTATTSSTVSSDSEGAVTSTAGVTSSITHATTTSTSTTLSADFGTRGNPVPVGQSAELGDWSVRVVDVNPNATQVVMDENIFNEPPDDGNVFYMVTLEATYVGSTSDEFYFAMTWKALGPSSVAYEEFDASCGVIPDSFNEVGEAFPGGQATANVCWEVSVADAADLLMILEESASFDEVRVFFDLTT